MKRRSALIIAILVMTIGFAAISTTLIINGSAKVSENTDDFSVIFTSASLDGTDVYGNVISGKIIEQHCFIPLSNAFTPNDFCFISLILPGILTFFF